MDENIGTTYLSISDPAYNEIEEEVRKTYQNSCIVWIEKIENFQLELLYDTYKSTINPPNEKRLFHGTTEFASRCIIRDGFDPSLNKASAYGKGVYFSKYASYSKNYAKRVKGEDIAYMFVCDVITGKTCVGKCNNPIPPKFNSAADHLKKPSMYIVNKREAAFPRYLVAFYPDAS